MTNGSHFYAFRHFSSYKGSLLSVLWFLIGQSAVSLLLASTVLFLMITFECNKHSSWCTFFLSLAHFLCLCSKIALQCSVPGVINAKSKRLFSAMNEVHKPAQHCHCLTSLLLRSFTGWPGLTQYLCHHKKRVA